MIAKPVLFVALLVLTIAGLSAPAEEEVQAAPRKVESVKIWDGAPHCAFGDLIRWKNRFLCTFREGTQHVHGRNGEIRVIASTDGIDWQSIALLKEKGIDLRDPKLCVMPDGSLMMSCGGSDYSDGLQEWHTRVAFSKDGLTWTPPRRVRGIPSNNWFFRLTWHKGVGYAMPNISGADPATGHPLRDEQTISLYKTTDGMNYERVCENLPLPHRTCEATIRFLEDDTLVAIMRYAGASPTTGFFVKSAPPYREYESAPIAHGMGGPNMVVMPDGSYVVGTRAWPNDRPHADGYATVLLRVYESGKFDRLSELPSGGDTGYPGMLIHDGSLWLNYYSSHEGTTAVYLAHVPLQELTLPDRSGAE